MCGLKVVDMEHKLGVKGDAAIQHGIGEKTSLAKKSESKFKSAARTVGNGAVIGAVAVGKGAVTVKRTVDKVAANPVVKTGGKVVSMVGAAAGKAIDSIDNETVQLVRKSYIIAKDTVRLGGKTVKIAAQASGKVIKNTFRLSRAIAQKVRLAKRKEKKLKVKTSKLYKAMAAANAAKKYVLKPAVKTAKIGVSAAGTVVDKAAGALGNVDDDTVQFAKKAYDVANAAGAVTYKAGKASIKVLKGTGKTARTLLTKKGRRGLVNSVKRSVQRVKRTVRNIRNVVKLTARAAKFIAKLAAKAAKLAAQLIAKLVNLIASTAPWSLIIIGVIALLIIAVNIVIAICGDETEDNVAGLGENREEIYENLAEFEEMFAEVSKEKVTEPLKSIVTSFCVPKSVPKNIIAYNGASYYPADGKDVTINPAIEAYISSSLSTERYIAFLAALKVLTLRETEERPELFTKADFEKFIGTVNGNVCTYGDTFFFKTTVTTGGHTCPGSNCRIRYCDTGCCTRTDSEGNEEKYCPGHRYCNHDHIKMTVTLRTVEEYTGKSVSEIYSFDEEEEYLFESYKYFIGLLIEEMNDPDNPIKPYNPSSGTSEGDMPEYKEPEFGISSRDTALLVILVVSIIMGLLFGKRKGG